MNLHELTKNWDRFGRDDPYWAILTDPNLKGNKWDEDAFFETGRKRIDKQVKQLKQIKSNFKFHSALDFGCGAGRLTQGLANHFTCVSGVDIAPSMIQLANEKNKKDNCTYFLNQKNDLSLFKNEAFDFVFSIITLQHMQPKYAKNYILEFIRILKPEGIIKFQIPSKPDMGTLLYQSPLKRMRRKINSFLKPNSDKNVDPIMEMYWIPIQELVTFLTNNGAQILSIKKNDSVGENWDSYTYIVSKEVNV